MTDTFRVYQGVTTAAVTLLFAWWSWTVWLGWWQPVMGRDRWIAWVLFLAESVLVVTMWWMLLESWI
jgi:hypothetical protein